MAAIEYTRVSHGSTGLFGRIGTFFTTVFGAVAGWNDARVTRNSLGKLSDRELEDIGLNRGDIDDVARGRRF